jgi:hypothetical protein
MTGLVRSGDVVRHPLRLELFAAACWLASAEGLVDRVISIQVEQLEINRRLAERGDRRQVKLAASGYLQELQDRIAWLLTHRHLLH